MHGSRGAEAVNGGLQERTDDELAACSAEVLES